MPSEVTITPAFTCTISSLQVTSLGAPGLSPSSIIRNDEPFRLSVQVDFVPGVAADAVLGAAALDLKAEFFAESYGNGNELSLGSTTISTAAGVYSYTINKDILSGAAAAGMTNNRAYKLAAVVRGGIPGGPTVAMLHGFIDGSVVESYSPGPAV